MRLQVTAHPEHEAIVLGSECVVANAKDHFLVKFSLAAGDIVKTCGSVFLNRRRSRALRVPVPLFRVGLWWFTVSAQSDRMACDGVRPACGITRRGATGRHPGGAGGVMVGGRRAWFEATELARPRGSRRRSSTERSRADEEMGRLESGGYRAATDSAVAMPCLAR